MFFSVYISTVLSTMCQTVNVIEKETKLMKTLSERVFFSFPEGAILNIYSENSVRINLFGIFRYQASISYYKNT